MIDGFPGGSECIWNLLRLRMIDGFPGGSECIWNLLRLHTIDGLPGRSKCIWNLLRLRTIDGLPRGHKPKGGERILYLRSLCFRDIFYGNGHGTTGLIGLNSDGGCVALCHLGGHKDFLVVDAAPAFV